jgi:acetyltransferase-like isoleucine patch superfamily enzyme
MKSKERRMHGGDPFSLLTRSINKLHSMWLSKTYPFASIGRKPSFHYTSKMPRALASRISIGNSVTLLEYVWLSPATDDAAGDPIIVIGDNCAIGFGTVINAKNQVHIERSVLICQSVLIADHSHAYENIHVPIIDQGITAGGRIRIGEGTWIGRGACIICTSGELTIGRNCVIATNALVTQSIPDYSVVAAGAPAVVTRQFDPETGEWHVGKIKNRASRTTERFDQPVAMV